MRKPFASFSRSLETVSAKGQPGPSAHPPALGHDPDDSLTFDLWRHIFSNPDTIIADWLTYLDGPLNEVRVTPLSPLRLTRRPTCPRLQRYSLPSLFRGKSPKQHSAVSPKPA